MRTWCAVGVCVAAAALAWSAPAAAGRSSTERSAPEAVRLLDVPYVPQSGALCGGAALAMVDEAPRAGLPPAHAGVDAGPLIERDGDYYGRTVNLASRIADRAGPGEVLVSAAARDAAAGAGISFEPIKEADLKGIADPVRLFRAGRPAAS